MKKKEILQLKELKKTYTNYIPKKQKEIIRAREWFPFKIKSELAANTAYIIGKVMGDGHLDNRFTVKFIGYKEDLNLLKDLIIQTFRIEKSRFGLYYRKNIGESYLLQVNDSLFGRFLYLFGAPQGNKTKIKFFIPKWIFLSKNNLRLFLQGIFEDELPTIKIKRVKYIQDATFRMAKEDNLQEELKIFLMEIKHATENFGVKCSLIGKPYLENKKENTTTYSQCFRIHGNKKNIKAFSENIGFKINQNKIKHLKQCLELC